MNQNGNRTLMVHIQIPHDLLFGIKTFENDLDLDFDLLFKNYNLGYVFKLRGGLE